MFGKVRWLLFGLITILLLRAIPAVESNQIGIPNEIQILDTGGVNPPSTGWVYTADTNWSEHTTTGVQHDVLYDEFLTEYTWSYTSQIQDSDGVDTVFFQTWSLINRSIVNYILYVVNYLSYSLYSSLFNYFEKEQVNF